MDPQLPVAGVGGTARRLGLAVGTRPPDTATIDPRAVQPGVALAKLRRATARAGDRRAAGKTDEPAPSFL